MTFDEIYVAVDCLLITGA